MRKHRLAASGRSFLRLGRKKNKSWLRYGPVVLAVWKG